jgi:type II secretory pathway component PulF
MAFNDTIYVTSVIALAIGVLILFLWSAFGRPGWALIGSFIAGVIALAGFVLILNLTRESEVLQVIGIILLAASVVWFPAVILSLNFIPVPDTQNDMPWWKFLARMVASIVFGLLLLAGLLICFHVIGFIFFIFFIVTVFRYLATARYNQALEFVSTLAAAMRQNLPLPTALQTAAIGRKDKTARIFRRTAHWLTQGYPLAEAIRKGYPRCLPEVVSTIESAEKLSQLPETLLSLEKDLVNNADETKKVRPVHPWYPAVVLIMIFTMTTGLMIFIMPTFSQVISDMSDGRSSLPAATRFLMYLTNEITHPSTFIILLSVVLVGIGLTSYYYFRTRVAYKPGLFLNIIDRIRWYWPLQRRLERNMATLRLVEILRHSLSAGWPLNQSIAAALGAKMNCCFQKRLRRWLGDVEQGLDAAQSARARGIGSSVAWALDGKINPGQAPALLEMLEETCRSKHNYLGNLIRSIMWPIVVLLMGLFVGFVVYAMFICLVRITTIGSGYIVP